MTDSSPGAAISGIGMLTSVGYRAPAAAAAIRAGIRRFIEIEDATDFEGELVCGAPIPLLEDHPTPRIEMMLGAASEAYRSAFPRVGECDGPVWVSISTATPTESGDTHLGRYPLERLQVAIPDLVIQSESEVRPGCHASALEAVACGTRMLSEGKVKACLIGGIDSLLPGERLARLEEEYRLRTTYNPHGLIPGEGAAFVVIEAEPSDRSQHAWARIGSVGIGMESNPITSDAPCLSEGLSTAIREATQDYCEPQRSILGVLCDLNGEPYRANEWSLARSRTLRWASVIDLWHPAECLGDVGAATGGVLLAVGATALQKGYSAGPELLLWAGSDSGTRCSVFLCRTSQPV